MNVSVELKCSNAIKKGHGCIHRESTSVNLTVEQLADVAALRRRATFATLSGDAWRPALPWHSMRFSRRLRPNVTNGSRPSDAIEHGLARACDWVVYCERRQCQDVEEASLLQRDHGELPSTVFVHARLGAMRFFLACVLPRLSRRFVLITGNADSTVPVQVDQRWQPWSATAMGSTFTHVLQHPLLVHWFAENLDTSDVPRLSPLPTGDYNPHKATTRPINLSKLPLRVLCVNRVHSDSPEWGKRRRVLALCNSTWKAFADAPGPIDPDEYSNTLARYPFTMCVQGGGLDPSPQAWQAIMAGSIPIMEYSPLFDAYARLPVAWVPGWKKRTLSTAQLERWLGELREYYEDPQLRRQTLFLLTEKYWWSEVMRRDWTMHTRQ